MFNQRSSLGVKASIIPLPLIIICAVLLSGLGASFSGLVQAEPSPQAGAFESRGLIFPDAILDIDEPDALPNAWQALNNDGLSGNVNAMVVYGDDLFVGGNFVSTGDGSITDLKYIARYDLNDGTWNTLPKGGLNGIVRSLALYGDDLYVGGLFTKTGDTLQDLSHIARYDITDKTWNELENGGLNGDVYAMTVSGDDLYMGGYFSETGDGSVYPMGKIVRYDITDGTWDKLANDGLNNAVLSLAVSGNDLYVSGNFSQTDDGIVTGLNRIARYDISGNTWIAMPNQGLNSAAMVLVLFGDDLYMVGAFTRTFEPDTDLYQIARYDTTNKNWHALPNNGLDGTFASGLILSGGDLYVGGDFSQTKDGTVPDLNKIARYNIAGKTWHALPNDGLDNWVYTFALSGDDLFVGGEFQATHDGALTELGHIARLTLKSGPKQLLSVTLEGSGSGKVTSVPAGINCGSDCSQNFNSGTVVTLKAVADPGSIFKGWSGDCSGKGDCQVTMDADKIVKAKFDTGLFIHLPAIFR